MTLVYQHIVASYSDFGPVEKYFPSNGDRVDTVQKIDRDEWLLFHPNWDRDEIPESGFQML